MKKELSLKKLTISNLNKIQLTSVIGGQIKTETEYPCDESNMGTCFTDIPYLCASFDGNCDPTYIYACG